MIESFEVSSSKEFHEALSQRKRVEGMRFAVVRVYGSKVLTRPFHIPKISFSELRSALSLEAADMFTDAAKDIVTVFRITGSDNKNMWGVYLAIPRSELLAYLSCFKESHLFPLTLTTSAIGSTIDFLKTQLSIGKDFCVINFIKATVIGIVIFFDGEPALFREIQGDNDAELEQGILDTIRYAYSRSNCKKVANIYFTGAVEGKEPLIDKIKAIEDKSGVTTSASPSQPVSLQVPNLFEPYVLRIEAYSSLIRILKMVSGGCAILGILLGIQFYYNYIQLSRFTTGAPKNQEQRIITDTKDPANEVRHAK